MRNLWRRAFEAALAAALLAAPVGSAETMSEVEPEVPAAICDPAWDVMAVESASCTDVFLGEYTLTAYCPCTRCCGKDDGITATGTQATQGRTIAVDPKVIPYGTRVVLIFPDGTQHTFTAEDCGGAIKGNRIDVYFDSHAEALQFGVRSAMAYVEGET